MSFAEDNGLDGWDISDTMSTSEAYTKDDGIYTNKKGEDVEISEMSDSYLINAYNYFLKHAGKGNDLVKDLKLEIRLRKI